MNDHKQVTHHGKQMLLLRRYAESSADAVSPAAPQWEQGNTGQSS